MFSKLKSKLRKSYIDNHTVDIFVDKTGHQGCTILKRDSFCKVPLANIFCCFPEIYDKEGISGSFQRFEQINGEFFAIYESISDEICFTVNKKLEIVE